jgi:hypothetical protein
MHLICVFFAPSRKGGATERGAFPFMQFAETGLEERFDRFMLSTPDVESIDKLRRLHEPTNLKRADYLACGRRAVISVGRVEIDPSERYGATSTNFYSIVRPAMATGRSRSR